MFRKLFGSKKAKLVVQIHDLEVDLIPIAEEVIELAPEPCGMDADRLAVLAQITFNGEYLKVSEYPEGIDREYAKLVIRRVQQWANWEYRSKQLQDMKADKFTIDAFDDACPKMRELDGKSCADTGFIRLPLNECWQRCNCSHRFSRKS